MLHVVIIKVACDEEELVTSVTPKRGGAPPNDEVMVMWREPCTPLVEAYSYM